MTDVGLAGGAPSGVRGEGRAGARFHGLVASAVSVSLCDTRGGERERGSLLLDDHVTYGQIDTHGLVLDCVPAPGVMSVDVVDGDGCVSRRPRDL